MGRTGKKKRRRPAAAPEDYWAQSVQPLYCLAFVAPLLILYEVGVLWLGPTAMRNGADVWLRQFLAGIGFGEYLFLPAATCGLLLCWHHLSSQSWKLSPHVLSGMICESFLIGTSVVIIARLLSGITGITFSVESEVPTPFVGRLPHMLSFLGAGIYEELLFRLVLISGAIVCCRKTGVDRISAIVFAIVSSSLLFAAAHYRLFFDVGFEFTWISFLFRAIAGVFFSVLFLFRGFGIAVGAHVVYDIVVVTLAFWL